MQTQNLHELTDTECMALTGGHFTLEEETGLMVSIAFGAGVATFAAPVLAVPLLGTAMAIGVTILIWDRL